LLQAYTCETYPCSEDGETYVDFSTVEPYAGSIAYSDGVFTFFKSYPVTAAQETINFYLEPYILKPGTETIVK
jgi:hypothetical protein